MRIALSGYGRMGKLIHTVAEAKGHQVVSIIDPLAPEAGNKEITRQAVAEAEVVIDFSIPSAATANIKQVCGFGKQIVVGTTGWYKEMDQIKKAVETGNGGCLWSGNFSLGVNIFFALAEYAGKVMNNFADYDPFIHEFHHNGKADSPSGTAVMLGNILIEQLDRKTSLVSEELKRKIEPRELHVSSTRGGSVPGTHSIFFDSPVDSIELKHTARSREGFARGAVAAAEWINGKEGFFTINQMMKEIIQGG